MDYFFIDNPLTGDPNDKMGILTNVRTYTDPQIVKRMMQRGTLLTETDILATLNLYSSEIGRIVEEGDGIHTDLINAQPSLVGKFIDVSDSFDGNRHKVTYNVNFSKAIQQKIGGYKMRKVQTPDTGPIIIAVKDSISGLTDGTLSAGGVLELSGHCLKIFTDMPDNGVVFIAADNTEYKASVFVDNKPSRFAVMIPVLLAGTYTLEVRTNYIKSSAPSKQLRKTQFDKPLTM
jgi:ribosomal protein S17E